MTGSGIATHFLVAASAAALVATGAFGQSADKPLGEILESIDAAEAEAPPSATEPPPSSAEAPPRPAPPRPSVTEGIVPTDLPPSQPAELPGEAEESPSEAPAEAQVLSITDAERLQAEAEAAEQARIAELDRRRAERIEAARQAREAALADYQRLLEEREAAIARAEADYQAALERNRLQAEQDRAAWQEQVGACEAGDRLRCFSPENPPR